MDDCIHNLAYTIHIISYVDDNTLLRTFDQGITLRRMFQTSSDNFTTWNKLLQVTGGDLCLEKCEVTAMYWTYDSMGVLQMLSKNTDQATVVVSNSSQALKGIKIARIDPREASRVLGIRLPMTGQMSVELAYRMGQTKKLAKIISVAPLSHYDAYVVYQSRYTAMVTFLFNVTLFTAEECDNIQKPFIYALYLKWERTDTLRGILSTDL